MHDLAEDQAQVERREPRPNVDDMGVVLPNALQPNRARLLVDPAVLSEGARLLGGAGQLRAWAVELVEGLVGHRPESVWPTGASVPIASARGGSRREHLHDLLNGRQESQQLAPATKVPRERAHLVELGAVAAARLCETSTDPLLRHAIPGHLEMPGLPGHWGDAARPDGDRTSRLVVGDFTRKHLDRFGDGRVDACLPSGRSQPSRA